MCCSQMIYISMLCVLVSTMSGFDNSPARADNDNGGRKAKEKEAKSESVTVEGVTLTIECSDTLISGAENYITLKLRNASNRVVTVYPPSRLYRGPGFKVFGHGRAIDTTALGQSSLWPSIVSAIGAPIRVGRGEEVRAVVNLSRYYDLSTAGDYQISAIWAGIADDDPANVIRFETKPLEFKVKVKPGESVSVP